MVDVNGDTPSIPKLQEAIVLRRGYLDLKEEMVDIKKRTDERSARTVRCRCEIYRPTAESLGFRTRVLIARGDTWDEVIQRMQETH